MYPTFSNGIGDSIRAKEFSSPHFRWLAQLSEAVLDISLIDGAPALDDRSPALTGRRPGVQFFRL